MSLALRTGDASHAGWPCVTSLDGDVGQLDAFLDHLCDVPRSVWLRIGATAAARSAPDALQQSIASAALDRVIATRRLAMPAWYVRDAVETAACHAHCQSDTTTGKQWMLPPCTDDEARRLAGARQAAVRAALALLAREWLPPLAFDALTAPFVEPQADAMSTDVVGRGPTAPAHGVR